MEELAAIDKIISILTQNLRSNNHHNVVEIIKKSDYETIFSRFISKGPVVRPIDGYKLNFTISPQEYNKISFSKSEYESVLMESINNIGLGDQILAVEISTRIDYVIDWMALPPGVDKTYILSVLDWEKSVLISTGTGEALIEDYNENYIKYHASISQILKDICLRHVNDFSDLWAWYHYYKVNLGSYASRRAYINELYTPLINLIENSEETEGRLLEYNLTGWEKIDRAVLIMREAKDKAEIETQHQSVGMHGRDILLTLAQTVYDKNKHIHPDGQLIGPEQSKRMLEAYVYSFSKILSDEETKFAKAAIDLTNKVTHDRNATRLNSETCYNAVISTIHVIHSINKFEKSQDNV